MNTTGPGAWQPVRGRGRPPRAAAPDDRHAPDPELPRTVGGPDAQSLPSAPDEAASARCVFCDRATESIQLAWPDWLFRFVTAYQTERVRERNQYRSDVVLLGRLEHELDKTVDCVCETCANGWIRRLDDNVRPFLQSMIVGEVTPLPPARRKVLARWAAKTAVIMECCDDDPVRTPRFVCDHLRKVGVHAGTQVLVGRYDDEMLLLTYERDLFSRMIDGEKRYFSQASFVIGKLMIHVFADPWRETAPEPVDDPAHPFITLVGSRDLQVAWPPGPSIDETRAPQHDLAPRPARGTNMPNDTHETSAPARQTESATTPEVDAHALSYESVGAFAAHAPQAPLPEPAQESLPGLAQAPLPPSSSEPIRPRRNRQLAMAVVVLAIVFGLLGFGLHERSNVATVRTRDTALQARVRTLEAQLAAEKKLSNTQAKILQADSVVSTTPNAPSSAKPTKLGQIVSAVPPVTNGLRECASAALGTASAAIRFASAYPHGTTAAVNANSATATSACATAESAADTLDGLASGAK